MALRNIVKYGDEVLRKNCRPVSEVTERIQTLVDDMIETMHEADGVGLAAPQVGVMRRLFVVDIGEGPIVLINPEIIERKGEQTGEEGCLSLPGKAGTVTRAEYVRIKGLNREGETVEYEGTGLLARALQHEYDHLDGILYIDRATETWTYEAE